MSLVSVAGFLGFFAKQQKHWVTYNLARCAPGESLECRLLSFDHVAHITKTLDDVQTQMVEVAPPVAVVARPVAVVRLPVVLAEVLEAEPDQLNWTGSTCNWPRLMARWAVASPGNKHQLHTGPAERSHQNNPTPDPG